MMKVVTAEEMRNIDKETIEGYGIPGSVLMERAGLCVAQRVKELFEEGRVVVLAGSGNNGGDGIVAGRNLFNWGWPVQIISMSREDKLSPGCRAQYEIASKMGVPIEFRTKITPRDFHGAAVVLDALLGTGLGKPVAPPLSEAVELLNKTSVPVVSVDIPTGVSSDDAGILGAGVRADYTVTFGLPKVGHLLPPGAEFAGRLFIEEIGFPRQLTSSDSLLAQTFDREDASLLLPERPENSYKGDYGHVLVVAGSRGKTGAPMMTARACLRSGAGMVTIGVPETLTDVFLSRVTEEMILPLPDTGEGILAAGAFTRIMDFLGGRADVLAIGPGLTAGPSIIGVVKKILETAAVPMVIDADGLNALSSMTNILEHVKAPVVLTPHEGEMARLIKGLEKKGGAGRKAASVSPEIIEAIEKDRIKIARDFAEKTGACLVLKGAPSLVADPGGNIFINTTGNPGMATAGAGDVLTGVIAAFLGQGLNPLDAAALGVYMHGLAGDAAAACKGPHSLAAGDIIEHMPEAFAALSGPAE